MTCSWTTCGSARPRWTYNSLRDLSDYLGKRFWNDLELHHPGIDSLRLPAEVVAGWRERLLTKPKTVTAETGNRTMISVPRINFRESLTKVRAFYLDLSQWVLEDPGRCAQWVAPCPVRQDDISHRKFKRRHKARTDTRTREPCRCRGQDRQIDRRSHTFGIPATVNYPAF